MLGVCYVHNRTNKTVPNKMCHTIHTKYIFFKRASPKVIVVSFHACNSVILIVQLETVLHETLEQLVNSSFFSHRLLQTLDSIFKVTKKVSLWDDDSANFLCNRIKSTQPTKSSHHFLLRLACTPVSPAITKHFLKKYKTVMDSLCTLLDVHITFFVSQPSLSYENDMKHHFMFVIPLFHFFLHYPFLL